ncbi:transcriptional regulator family: bZIP [Penicillium roqueforti]|nr:transcriptional regulator family: bZIP [Penicillium roqueforti]KAI3117239.1 transcriptional regulator family: bZIP [Penicillium roqueforti]
MPIARVHRFGVVLAFMAVHALPTLNIIPHPSTALTSLAGFLNPAYHPSRGPSRVFFHSNLTLVVGVNALRYYAIPRDTNPCSDFNYCSDPHYSSGNRNPRSEGLNGITDFQPDLTGSNVQVPMHNAHFPAVPSVPSGPVAASQAPLQPAPIHTAPKVAQTPSSVSMSPSTPVTGTKRKNSAHSSQESAEEASRQMAEEDKRRRNTAASARFRVKKKQREAALEQTVKETTDKNDILEARVSQLELENHWLRGLIMEKNGADEQSEQDISNMFKKFLASQKADESSISDLKRGVGTTV